jgi:hypothetical protein
MIRCISCGSDGLRVERNQRGEVVYTCPQPGCFKAFRTIDWIRHVHAGEDIHLPEKVSERPAIVGEWT